MRCFWLFYWLRGISWLAGCQPKALAPARITAANYLTAIPDPKALGKTYVSDPAELIAGYAVLDATRGDLNRDAPRLAGGAAPARRAKGLRRRRSPH